MSRNVCVLGVSCKEDGLVPMLANTVASMVRAASPAGNLALRVRLASRGMTSSTAMVILRSSADAELRSSLLGSAARLRELQAEVDMFSPAWMRSENMAEGQEGLFGAKGPFTSLYLSPDMEL